MTAGLSRAGSAICVGLLVALSYGVVLAAQASDPIRIDLGPGTDPDGRTGATSTPPWAGAVLS
jgi:hypothetical protein